MQEDHIIGSFTNYNNKINGLFSTTPVKGEEIIVELYLPSIESEVFFTISQIAHDYKGIYDYGQSEECNNNVNCPEWSEWYDQKRSVAMMLIDENTRICSGSLINNVENEPKQYFLTAYHCFEHFNYVPGDYLPWILMFNYESPFCINEEGATDQTIQGLMIRSVNAESDFALLEIIDIEIPESYDGYSISEDSTKTTILFFGLEGSFHKLRIW